MTDKKTIFSTGEITYDKEWYIKSGLSVKPVVYTEQFLKEIASNTVGSSLELTHGNSTKDVVGHINSFDFTDGELVANVVTNESLENMGFSPEFSANFIDRGDRYEAIDGKLEKTILTDSPRSHILCNSVEGGSNMNEDLINTLNGQIKDLNKQVAQKEATIEANKKKLEKYNELSEKVAKLEEENNNYKAQIDGLKPKAEAFAKIEDNMKADALTRAFGDDEEAKNKFKDLPLDKIEELANHRENYKPANGLGANNIEDPVDPNNQSSEPEPTAAEKALEFYKKTHNGEAPSFLKEEGGQ